MAVQAETQSQVLTEHSRSVLHPWREPFVLPVPIDRRSKKILLIGQSPESLILAENVNRIAKNYQVAGCLRLNNREPVDAMPHMALPVLGDLTELDGFMAVAPPKLKVILIGDPDIRQHQILKIIDFARNHNLEVWVRPQLSTAFYGDLRFRYFYGHPIIRIVREPARLKIWIKTGLDYALATLGLLAAAPIMLAVALAVRVSSRGPVLYLQTRVGLYGRSFQVIKFRSMSYNAEAASGPVLACSKDARTTPLGRILRLTHLDELPQFFNVLNGTMSMVGPRPERPFFVDRFTREIPYYGERLTMKPGITGMAQVYGNYDSRPEEKLIFDLNYIHHFTIWQDVKICLLTLWNAVRKIFPDEPH